MEKRAQCRDEERRVMGPMCVEAAMCVYLHSGGNERENGGLRSV